MSNAARRGIITTMTNNTPQKRIFFRADRGFSFSDIFTMLRDKNIIKTHFILVTPNKVTLIKVDDLLIELNVNPIQKLIEIAESNEANLDQRINFYKEIDKYTYPRFKSQELRVTPLENLTPTVIELVPGTGTNTNT